MPKNTCKVTKEQFLERLFENNGNAFKSYTELNMPYSMYWKWLSTDEDFKAKVEESRKKQVQWVESKLFQGIANGDAGLIKFYLNCKGGYVSQKNVTAEVKSDNTVDINSALDEIKNELD